MAKERQQSLIDSPADSGPVECLGMTFENDAARREHFLGLLAEKLKDPEFRKIEGFPIGENEDILALSDPPYYTACPNPWFAEWVHFWEKQKPQSQAAYLREPFAADVSEGKNDPIYNAHSYHTKVPHKAIMRYVLHYTEPGDIILDAFCGTGMAGIAAQLCGDEDVVKSLGYKVLNDGSIQEEAIADDGSKVWTTFSRIGQRRCLLSDLSPAATFITYHYNHPIDTSRFAKEFEEVLAEIELEYSWMYETKLPDGRTGKVNYVIWSDVFICPSCGNEIVFWDSAVDHDAKEVRKEFNCPSCDAQVTKRNVEPAWTMSNDATGIAVKQTKRLPVVVNYSIGDKKRHEKPVSDFDLQIIERINNMPLPCWVPTTEVPIGDETGRLSRAGLTHAYHLFTKRNLILLGVAWEKALASGSRMPFVITASQRALSKMASIAFSYYFHGGGGFVNAGTKGTLYVSSTNPEVSVFTSLRSRMRSMLFDLNTSSSAVAIETKSSTSKSSLPDNSLDYVFVDPPFGSNINYSDLNFLWEPWLKILTNNDTEAIESKSQKKSTADYRELMKQGFSEIYRVLKPGRWMTVEFSNTKAIVWNCIQTAISEAGFIVANVSALDKKQGSFKAYTTPTAVKQDLVISAYKPNGGFEERFSKSPATESSVWDFVSTHLSYLPVIKKKGSQIQFIPERDPRILFDQMVAYYVRRGLSVPMSSQEFQQGLSQYPERDGMVFLPNQAAEYDCSRIKSEKLAQTTLFITDESSSIHWLRALLKNKPQKFAEINGQFMKQLTGWSKKEEAIDLRELLAQNFLCYDGESDLPEQIHSYLSSNWKDYRNLDKGDLKLRAKAKDRWYVPDPTKAGDLARLREKTLLREFNEYLEGRTKLRIFRIEAIRAGFKNAWQNQDYEIIVKVSSRIPTAILESDEALLMYYDNALMRTED